MLLNNRIMCGMAQTVALLCVLGLASPSTPAQSAALTMPVATPPAFYGANGPNPARWYHVVPFGEGRIAETIKGIYDRIANTDKPRKDPARLDTIIGFGPGHWVYEWEREGERVLALARDAERAGNAALAEKEFLEAAYLFSVASSPHLRTDANAMRALGKARAAYQAGALHFPGSFRVDKISHAGKTFEAYLHLPPGNGPFPLLVASNGSDVVKEQASPVLRKELIRRGIALLTLDMPGIGGGSAYNLSPDSDELHVAAIQHIRSDPAIDPRKVAMMGTSFGGHAAARILFRSELALSGVIAACGPLHKVFMTPVQVVPALVRDGVQDRVGLPPGASFDELAVKLRAFSLKNRQLLETGRKVSTPLLILATDADPVAPLDDLPIVSDATTSVKTIVYHQQGHCPDPFAAQPAAALWLESQFAKSRP